MSIIDCVTETGEVDSIPVERLAERAIELCWPQTTAYPTTRRVLSQNQGSQAKIVRAIVEYRTGAGVATRAISRPAPCRVTSMLAASTWIDQLALSKHGTRNERIQDWAECRAASENKNDV